jgi:1-acyl-sn-glycerol-3-phosphate acyltransferase
VILAPNHLSYADWGTVALFSYEAGRYPTFLIKSPVFGVKGLGPFLHKVGQLPVYRNRGDAALVLREAERAVLAGETVVVYAEGTASRDPDLWPMKARTGVARLALRTGAPVIPMAIWGAQDVLPYGTSRPHLWPRKTIQLAAGPPVDLSAFQGLPLTATTLRNATAVVMADVTALLAGLRGETPPAVPYDPDAGKASISRTSRPERRAGAGPQAGPNGGPHAGTGQPGGEPVASEDPAEGPDAEARPT